jgi:ubiquinone/menaquinone biosynthesis C-methylase UbiE
MVSDRPIQRAFDGSTPAFRALRAWGWDELLNLGYFRVHELPLLAFGMAHFQRRLSLNAIALLDPRPGETVLDVGCGRGWSSRQIASRGARTVGLDRLEEHVEHARERYGNGEGLRYEVGDATRLAGRVAELGLEEESVSGVLCLEAAFQFGAAGRQAFLADSFRVLEPGGRLVLVDFTWTDDRPERIAELDCDRHVRDTWQFEEFEPLERYRSTAKALGFVEGALLDWSAPVINRFCTLCTVLTTLARFRVSRYLLCRLRPGLLTLAPSDWAVFADIVRAHDRVRESSRYMAMVLEKP